jgi:energy-coupling factor transporter ATP-binding protein EcfA2
LYAVYRNPDTSLYPNFLSSLNYILFDNQTTLRFLIESDIQKDARVSINFQIGDNDTPKDIALLGSGSLQVVEILLSLYYRDNRDMNLLLLDEPDSHIHRDIQKRLLKVITDFSSGNQIFLTTHNEALIRESAPRHLFHLENTPTNRYKPLNSAELVQLEKTGGKRSFKGIYPLQTNAIIRSLGNSTGLDFINAIEADRIIFVEGEDDAQAIYTLLQKATIPPTRTKYVFWVLNGISNVFKEIEMYQTLFSQIKNERSLWEKSVLIMDRDFLSDEHYPIIRQKMTEKFLPTYITSAYTLESTILTDLKIASDLVHFWLKDKGIDSNSSDIEATLSAEYHACKDVIQSRLEDSLSIKKTVQHYRDIREKTEVLFKKNNRPIRQDDIALTTHYQDHLKHCLEKGALFKLMNKDDVERIIKAVLEPYSISFEIDKDFIDLLKNVAPGRWFSEWDFLKPLVK